MTSRDLYRNMSGINPLYIIEAAPNAEASLKHKSKFRIQWAALAACLAICVCLGTVLHSVWINSPVGAFTMDVNPGVRFTVAKNGNIKNVQFLNSEAEKALDGIVLEKQSVKEALKRSILAYQASGYIKSGKSIIMISFDSKICADSKLKAEISDTIQTAVKESDAVETLIFHNDSDSEKAKELAKKYGISVGKADLLIAASAKRDVADEVIAKLPIENLIDMQEDQEFTVIKPRFIDLPTAKKIAMDDSGCDVSEKIIFTAEELISGGIKTPYYRLVFENSKFKWSYKIDAVNGNILSKEQTEIVKEKTDLVKEQTVTDSSRKIVP